MLEDSDFKVQLSDEEVEETLTLNVLDNDSEINADVVSDQIDLPDSLIIDEEEEDLDQPEPSSSIYEKKDTPRKKNLPVWEEKNLLEIHTTFQGTFSKLGDVEKIPLEYFVMIEL